MVEIKDLRMGHPAPNFRLPASDGRDVELRQFRHRQPLAVYFLHDSACKVCRAVLKQFKSVYPEYQAEGVEVIAIIPQDVATAAALKQELSILFPILSDAQGTARERYLGEARAGLFLLDRYNAQQVGETAPDADRLMLPREALSWIVFSETTCAECGVLEWKTDD